MGFGDFYLSFLPCYCHDYCEEYGYADRWHRSKAYSMLSVLTSKRSVWHSLIPVKVWRYSSSDPWWSKTEKSLLETQTWTSLIDKELFGGGAREPKVGGPDGGHVILVL